MSTIAYINQVFPLLTNNIDTFLQARWASSSGSVYTSIGLVRFLFYRFISLDTLVFLEEQCRPVLSSSWNLETIRDTFFDRREWSNM